MSRRPTSVVRIAIKAIDQTKEGLNGPIKNLKDLQSRVRALGPAMTVATGAAAAGFAAIAKSLIDSRQAMGEFSDRIGITTENLSRLKFAAEQTGVEFNALQTALQRQTRRIAEASTGTVEAVEMLGLSIEELRGQKPGEQFKTIARGFDSVDDSGQRALIAMRLWDTEGVKLLQTLSNGSQGLEEMTRQADALGITFSQSSVKAVQRMNESLGVMKAAVAGLVNQFLTGLFPAIEALSSSQSLSGLEGIQKLMRNIGKFVGEAVHSFFFLYEAIQLSFQNATLSMDRFFNLMVTTAKSAAAVLVSIFKAAIVKIVNSIIDIQNAFTQKLPAKVRGFLGFGNDIPKFQIDGGDLSASIAKANTEIKNAIRGLKSVGEVGKHNLQELSRMWLDFGNSLNKFERQVTERATPNTIDTSGINNQLVPDPVMGITDTDQAIEKFGTLQEKVNQTSILIQNFTSQVGNSIGTTLGNIFSGATKAGEAFSSLAKSILQTLGQVVGQMITVAITEKVLTLASSKILKTAQITATAGYAAMLPTLATAATLSAIATGGASLSAAGLVPVAVAANNAILTAVNALFSGAGAGGGLSGQAHDGLTSVPREGTYLLDKGERVLSPDQNADLTDFLQNRPTTLNLVLDGQVLGSAITNLHDRGLIEVTL